MNGVNSIEILTESAPGKFIAEYLMSKTIYSINCVDFQSFKNSDSKNKKGNILLLDAYMPVLSEYLKEKSIFNKFLAVAIFNFKKENLPCSYLIRQVEKAGRIRLPKYKLPVRRPVPRVALDTFIITAYSLY